MVPIAHRNPPPRSNRKRGRLVHQTISATRSLPVAEVVRKIKDGLPFGELADLQEQLGLPMERVASLLGIARATLQRRKEKGILDPLESDRVLRYARLLGKATAIFGSLAPARSWLTAPQVGLAGAIPLEFAQTETGAREVEALLTRIDYGVYA